LIANYKQSVGLIRGLAANWFCSAFIIPLERHPAKTDAEKNMSKLSFGECITLGGVVIISLVLAHARHVPLTFEF